LASSAEFLTDRTLDPPQATSDEAGKPSLDEDYLILSTIHSAKGQEWKAVSILNVVDGCIPSDLATGTAEEFEEERRLLYVVPQFLYPSAGPHRRQACVCGAQPVHSRGLGSPLQPCELADSGRDEKQGPIASAQVDIRERMRGMWSKTGDQPRLRRSCPARD
jgi:hypothetical protein